MTCMKSWLLSLAVVGACADPVIEMSLRLPTENPDFDMSCVTAVDMYVYGGRYEVDRNDYIYDCRTITPGMKYADVRTGIHNQFSINLPDTGLYGVELEAHTGVCDPQKAPQDSSNLMFNASAKYFGGNTLPLTITPIASCPTTSMKVRAVDVLALNTTKDCAKATIPDATAALFLGQLAPSLIDGVFYWSNYQGGTWAASVGTNMGNATISTHSCLAGDIGTNDIWSVSCIQTTGPSVCAAADEREVGVINMTPAISALDQNKISKWGAVVMGAVWTTSGVTKAPVSGATVTVDADKGEVDYVDPDAGGVLRKLTGTATGASGMFVFYTNALSQITVKSGTKMRQLVVGADKKYPAVSLIMLP
jgi:hypothetical protein